MHRLVYDLNTNHALCGFSVLLTVSAAESDDACSWLNASLTLTLPSIGGVSVITRHAGLAVWAGSEVTTLLTHTPVHTSAVAVTLAG